METNKKEHAAELTASAARVIESPEAFEKAMTALKTGVDEKRAAYVTTVQDFLYSYQKDVQKAVAALSEIEDAIPTAESELEQLRESVGALVMAGEPEKLEAAEAEIAEKVATLDKLKERREILSKYRPTGATPFLTVAETRERDWRSAKAKADKITAAMVEALDMKITELVAMKATAKRGIWSDVQIPAELRLGELKQKGRGCYTAAEELNRQEKKAKEDADRAEALRIQRERWPELFSDSKTETVERKPIRKKIFTPDRGEVEYTLDKETGEYREAFDGSKITKS